MVWAQARGVGTWSVSHFDPDGASWPTWCDMEGWVGYLPCAGRGGTVENEAGSPIHKKGL